MKLEVRGKDFEINFVSNYVHEEYNKMREACVEMSDIQIAVSNIEKLPQEEALKTIHDARVKIKDVGSDIKGIRSDILRELVETNGYDFDETFWSRKTTPDDINDFIVTCVQKDSGSSSVKKK